MENTHSCVLLHPSFVFVDRAAESLAYFLAYFVACLLTCFLTSTLVLAFRAVNRCFPRGVGLELDWVGFGLGFGLDWGWVWVGLELG